MSLRHQGRNVSILTLLSLPICLLVTSPAHAQTMQAESRGIISEEFVKNRKEVEQPNSSTEMLGGQIPKSNTHSKRKPLKRVYRLASSPTKKTRPVPNEGSVEQLGITVWRLRPVVAADDAGSRLLVRENNKATEQVPERVEADTTFRDGDKVRLSIESAREGYLYVINRDLFVDGSYGPPMLIYPWAGMRREDNRVGPGKLVDIPAQEDSPSYFTARLSSPKQVGEVLTALVTSTPLNVAVSDKPIQLSSAEVAEWERTWGGPSERFELEGGAGEVWTQQEQQAAAQKGARQLTREDPAPQTIYRVSVPNNKGLLVNLHLNYVRPKV